MGAGHGGGTNLPFGQIGSGKKKATTFLGVPLQGWAIAGISVVAVGWAAGWAFISLKGRFEEERYQVLALQEKTTKQQAIIDSASVTTEIRISESEKHQKLRDAFKIFEIDRSSGHPVKAAYYSSDGCIRVTRSHGGSRPYGISDEQDLWIPDPSRQQVANNNLRDRPLLDQVQDTNSRSRPLHPPEAAMHPRLKLASVGASDEHVVLKRIQAGCLNPHPWAFQTWWGPANGCFAPLYRRWNDGCTHYQIYNACNGIWNPSIYWTFCAAQHHP